MKPFALKVISLSMILCLLTGCSKKESAKEPDKDVKTTEEVTPVEEQKPAETATPTEEATPTQEATPTEEPELQTVAELPSLTWFGTASVKIKTKDGVVIYIDPYADGDYSEPADLILVTHGHSDHNNVSLVTTKDTTKTILYSDMHPSADEYKSTEEGNIKITAVPAYNSNHTKQFCVGYILEFDGIKLYHPGDTSKIDEMKDLTSLNLTYALYPTDGSYNMGPEEATECANLVAAKHSIPIHNMSVTIDELKEKFTPDGALIMNCGDSITLEP